MVAGYYFDITETIAGSPSTDSTQVKKEEKREQKRARHVMQRMRAAISNRLVRSEFTDLQS